jgi:hypothetical protein
MKEQIAPKIGQSVDRGHKPGSRHPGPRFGPRKSGKLETFRRSGRRNLRCTAQLNPPENEITCHVYGSAGPKPAEQQRQEKSYCSVSLVEVYGSEATHKPARPVNNPVQPIEPERSYDKCKTGSCASKEKCHSQGGSRWLAVSAVDHSQLTGCSASTFSRSSASRCSSPREVGSASSRTSPIVFT